MEDRKRSIIKAITWRIIATTAITIAAFFITGSWVWAGAIGMADLVVKLMLYYLHERVWNKISWGKK